MRINGIVGLARRVRRELTGGASAARIEQLRLAVGQALDVTRQALRQAHLGPTALASPTRAAYQFLTSVDFDRVQPAAAPPPGQPPHGHTPRDSVHFPGLRAWLDATLTRLSRATDDAERCEVHAAIQTTHANMEQDLRAADLGDGHLKPEARALRGWLAHFAGAEPFAAYVRGLAHAHAALAEAQRRQRRFPAPVVIHFRPMKSVYRVHGGADGTRVHLPTPMIAFDPPLFRLLAALALLREGSARPILEAMDAPEYQALRARVEPRGEEESSRQAASGAPSVDAESEAPLFALLTPSSSPPSGGQEPEQQGSRPRPAAGMDDAAGLHHSLAESFERTNAAYFAAATPRPVLHWSKAFTTRKFGHYDHVHDAVMVSASLDRPDVPAYVIDYIVYHELLHKRLGIVWQGNRKAVHTPAFRAEERRFARYAEAKAFLERFARGG